MRHFSDGRCQLLLFNQKKQTKMRPKFFLKATSAQDTTAAGAAASAGLPSWLPLVGGIVVGIYELLARLIPTVKNYSILSAVISVIQAILPNKNAATPTQPHA